MRELKSPLIILKKKLERVQKDLNNPNKSHRGIYLEQEKNHLISVIKDIEESNKSKRVVA